jgi:restriction system protein
MQEFVGAMTKFGAKKGYFVTTSEFSRQAVKFAEGLNVELIDGHDLLDMIAGIETFPSPAEFSRQHA